MKSFFRKIFSFILTPLEAGSGEFHYKPSHRTILIGVGSLFLALCMISIISMLASDQLGGMIPAVVFFVVSSVCVIVGTLGSERAVAKLWGNR
ncbi:MAG: hypothetical protein P1U57_14245 [Oleibacter sp.]|nr:hypothetical protein [Thalassolituus sp.]